MAYNKSGSSTGWLNIPALHTDAANATFLEVHFTPDLIPAFILQNFTKINFQNKLEILFLIFQLK